MERFVTRMGDGFRVEMTEAEIRRDIEEATQDASKRAKIPPLTEDEIKYLVELFKSPENEVGVKKGNEVVLSYDSGTTKFKRANVSVSKIQSLQIYERMCGLDPVVMAEVREELDIGMVNAVPRLTKGMDAKFRIAEVLGIEINCVNRFKRKVGLLA